MGAPLVLWLGAEDLLVRKVSQRGDFGVDELDAIRSGLPEDMQAMVQGLSSTPAFDMETETSYSPEKDQPVNPAEFEDPAV